MLHLSYTFTVEGYFVQKLTLKTMKVKFSRTESVNEM